MSKYAEFDINGNPIAFFDESFNGTFGSQTSSIPNTATLITNQQWTNFVTYPGLYVWDSINNRQIPATVAPLALGDVKLNAIAAVAALRYQKETNGIMVNGSFIATDRESQAQIMGVYTALKNNMISSVNFKTLNGWVTLDSTSVVTIVMAVVTHVQLCFSTEYQMTNTINGLTTIAAVNSYNINVGWPA